MFRCTAESAVQGCLSNKQMLNNEMGGQADWVACSGDDGESAVRVFRQARDTES